MIAVDTNILFSALETSHEKHGDAPAFLAGLEPGETAVCEPRRVWPVRDRRVS